MIATALAMGAAMTAGGKIRSVLRRVIAPRLDRHRQRMDPAFATTQLHTARYRHATASSESCYAIVIFSTDTSGARYQTRCVLGARMLLSSGNDDRLERFGPADGVNRSLGLV